MNTLLSKFILALIRFYQYAISPLIPPRCGGECGFSGGGCGGLLLLLRGLLCRIGFGAGEEMFPAGKDCQRDGKKCH